MREALSAARLAPRLAPLAVVLAGAWLLWQLVRLTWLLLAGPTLPAPTSAAPVAVQLVATTPTQAVSVAKWHLFGDPGARLDLARLAQQAPATSLKLVLRGTFSEDGPQGGFAIVSDESAVHRRYRVGDRLPGDAELIGIYSGRILLRRAGQDESLSLPTAVAGEASAAGRPPGSTGVTGGAASTTAGAASRPTVPAFINPNISTGMPSLESIRAATGTDIAELARQVSVFPVLENGRFSGVRLSVGRDSDLLDRAGLRPTDIITAVNGIPLDGPERIAELTAALRDSRQLNLAVRRDGNTLQIPVGL